MIISTRGFGATSPTTQGDCPVSQFEKDWAGWCDCMWPFSLAPNENTRCKQTATNNVWWGFTHLPGSGFAPWTLMGRAARDISWPGMEEGAGATAANIWRFVVDPIGIWNTKDVVPGVEPGAGGAPSGGSTVRPGGPSVGGRPHPRRKSNTTLYLVGGGAALLILAALVRRSRKQT